MTRDHTATSPGRIIAGASLIAAPLLLGVGELLRFRIEAGSFTGEEEHLANVAAHAGLWQTMTVLNMAAVILFVPAVLGLIRLTRRGAPVLSYVGGGLALVGTLGAAGHNVFAHVLDGAMAQLDGARSEMVQLAAELELSPSFLVVLLMFLIGFVLGLILLGVGLYRSRTTPRWAALAILLGTLVFGNAGTSLPLTLVAFVLLTVGMATTGYRVLTMTDARWDRLSRHAAATDAVPVDEEAVRLP